METGYISCQGLMDDYATNELSRDGGDLILEGTFGGRYSSEGGFDSGDGSPDPTPASEASTGFAAFTEVALANGVPEDEVADLISISLVEYLKVPVGEMRTTWRGTTLVRAVNNETGIPYEIDIDAVVEIIRRRSGG